ncbi:MAG: hypothetical protein M3198_03575 [Actinomycetota bacterium]|nr:hypothetical protein [Actinomycetota bacterium]
MGAKKNNHLQIVRAGRALSARIDRSHLAKYIRGMVLVRPRGRSVLFETQGNEALEEALHRRPDFCRDTRLGGALHAGGVSFRQLDGASGLHITLGPFERAAIHIDRAGPAVGVNRDGTCIYDRSRYPRHLRQDVLPSLVLAAEESALTRRRRGPTLSKPGLPVLRVSGAGQAHRMYSFEVGTLSCGVGVDSSTGPTRHHVEVHPRRAPPNHPSPLSLVVCTGGVIPSDSHLKDEEVVTSKAPETKGKK